ncbi:hypothetical protein MYRNA_205 [Mycobacterium phage Myrna]|uniref:Uncharacterized protein n=1 Tax=Mycobacterium phage Myrna TaxID=546805 RepID=B5LJH7_9CAUD|nr:gp205 [Mycobacterium phage Myrna]ACH62174.1 hypothetical protein MYRNA_205 [Mycobacterium phage Myrna]
MLVSELKQSLEGVNEQSLEVTFSGIAVDDEARSLRIDTGSHEGTREFQFDEQLERSLSKYLGVSKSYLAKCPPDLKAHNLNYWLDQKPNVAVTVEVLDDRVVAFHRPNLVILPIREVADVITQAMEPGDEVVQLLRDETSFHIDIITPKSVEVDPVEGIEDRQRGERQIGDITRGGVRVLSSPTEVKPPVVVPYLHRLWCTNGCSAPVEDGTIRLRGNTVEEVLEEMNQVMRRVRGNIDQQLEDFAEMASKRVPGSPSRFARQIGNEYGIPARVMTRVLDRVELLPEDTATLYDVQQVFTQAANGTVPYRTMMRLQTLAGDMAMDTDTVVHRCQTCERLLPE